MPRDNAQALTNSLQGLASSGLQVVIAGSEGAALPASQRLVELELVGQDQVGIVSKLTKLLAERAISIESIHTDIVRSSAAGQKTFKVKAQLRVPASMSVEALQRDVGAPGQRHDAGHRPGRGRTGRALIQPAIAALCCSGAQFAFSGTLRMLDGSCRPAARGTR